MSYFSKFLESTVEFPGYHSSWIYGVSIWNVENGKLESNFVKEFNYVKCFAIHPTGRILAIAAQNEIKIWDLINNQTIQNLDFHCPKTRTKRV